MTEYATCERVPCMGAFNGKTGTTDCVWRLHSHVLISVNDLQPFTADRIPFYIFVSLGVCVCSISRYGCENLIQNWSQFIGLYQNEIWKWHKGKIKNKRISLESKCLAVGTEQKGTREQLQGCGLFSFHILYYFIWQWPYDNLYHIILCFYHQNQCAERSRADPPP